MTWAPLARIILRYVAGFAIGGSMTLGNTLAADPDLVMYVALGIGATVEAVYAIAKRKGWAT
jgi:hypothetical protein